MKTIPGCKIAVIELLAQTPSFEDILDIARAKVVCTIRAIIEPPVAKKMLDNLNEHNRGVRKGQRLFIGQQIADGTFEFNGESIVVGVSGNLLNGQHRLLGCVDQNTPIEVLIVFGIPDPLFVTFDQGSQRSGGDALAVAGKAYSNLMAATLRHIDNYERGSFIGGNNVRRGSGKLSNAELLVLAKNHKKIDASVRRADQFNKRCCGLTPPSVVGALHYLFSSVDPTVAEEFISLVEDGCLPNKKYDENLALAATRLKKMLENNTRGPRRAPPATLAAVWIKAWNSYMAGDIPQVFFYRSNEAAPRIAGLEAT